MVWNMGTVVAIWGEESVLGVVVWEVVCVGGCWGSQEDSVGWTGGWEVVGAVGRSEVLGASVVFSHIACPFVS